MRVMKIDTPNAITTPMIVKTVLVLFWVATAAPAAPR